MDLEKNARGLHIIIIGCGKVGMTLVEQLTKENHDITIVDKNASKIQTVCNLYDIIGIVGNGASYETQMEAGIEKADLLISVTESDELNLLCCTIAKHTGNCATIARVRTPDYSLEANYLREKLGLTMIINPELEMANETARILGLPAALEVNSFAHGQVEMTKIKVGPEIQLAGMKISEMSHLIDKKLMNSLNICAIERKGEVQIPSGASVIEEGDILSYVATRKVSQDFLQKIGFKTKPVSNAMIVGGGKAAYYLALQLINMGIKVKIIESNAARCEELSVLLPKAIIIHGDGTDEDLLREEGLSYVESFIPLTGIDEENILLTLHAGNTSKAKVITKINKITFRETISKLNLGSVVYPRYITSEAIVAYVRAKQNTINTNIETLYHIFDSRAEAIEFRVDEESAITGTPLKNLHLKKNLIISFINRGGRIIIPSGQDTIAVGDTVMIVTKHTGLKNLLDIREN